MESEAQAKAGKEGRQDQKQDHKREYPFSHKREVSLEQKQRNWQLLVEPEDGYSSCPQSWVQ